MLTKSSDMRKTKTPRVQKKGTLGATLFCTLGAFVSCIYIFAIVNIIVNIIKLFLMRADLRWQSTANYKNLCMVCSS